MALQLTDGEREKAKDLVREVFFKAWEEGYQLDGENTMGIQWFLDATRALFYEEYAFHRVSVKPSPPSDLLPEQIIQLLFIQGLSPREIREQYQLDDQQWNTQLILAMRMIRDISSNA